MFENVENFSEVLPGLLTLLASVAGWRAGQLPLRATAGSCRRSARRVLALLATVTVLTVLEIALIGVMWSYGWVFAANRVVVALPPLIVPLVVAIAVAWPRLRRVATSAGSEPEAAAPWRPLVSDPRLVVPVHVTAVGALLCFLVVFVIRPVPPYALDALVVDGVLVLAAALLTARQCRRRRRAGEPPAPFGVALRVLRAAGAVVLIAGVTGGLAVAPAGASRLPERYDMGTGPVMDYGGSSAEMPISSTSVAALVGRDTAGAPDAAFTLTAQQAPVRLSSGRVVPALTFNGQVPGPELRVHDGDLVEVTLINRLPGVAVTIHWHGIDLPNAADGVPGVTQDAVAPGQRFVYRFRVHQVGTFWYHSHQDPLDEVDRGLFGALVVQPRTPPLAGRDLTVLAHRWNALGGLTTLDTADVLTARRVEPGTPVRLRLVNTSSTSGTAAEPPTFTLTGVPFRVAAIDGTDLHQPSDLPAGTRLALGAGGRRDLTFAMPDHPIRLTDLDSPTGGLVLSPDGTLTGAPPPVLGGPEFDPTHYGTPAPTSFTAASRFDRRFTQILDDGPSFYDGAFGFHPTINGATFPNTPMLMVAPGDQVKVTLVDRGHLDHPMHLHGHHALVLAHNGRPVTGSPWWTDTLDLVPGETFEIAFRADNPGIWMDHCHTLEHAASGMIMHLGYIGVHTPYRAGRASGNQPE